MRLQCSHYIPKHVKGRDGRLPCVVYCHCNSGSRRDAEEAICILIPQGVSVFAIDFAVSGGRFQIRLRSFFCPCHVVLRAPVDGVSVATGPLLPPASLTPRRMMQQTIPCRPTMAPSRMQGSGLSEGQWVTLGAEEQNDVEVAVAYLRATGKVSTLGLWGRSMGAVTALLYSQRDPSIAGMVRPGRMQPCGCMHACRVRGVVVCAHGRRAVRQGCVRTCTQAMQCMRG